MATYNGPPAYCSACGGDHRPHVPVPTLPQDRPGWRMTDGSHAPWRMDCIRRANEDARMYWFSPDTMRFFRSRVLDQVYQGPGGIYFVSSERGPEMPRLYTVRRFCPDTGGVETAEEFQGYAKATQARRVAARLAAAALEGATATVPE